MNHTRREFGKIIASGIVSAATLPLFGNTLPLPPPIDWSRFVDPDSFRYVMGTPWVENGWKCATTSRIAIRVGMPGEPNSPPPENGKRPKLLDILDWSVSADEAWIPWPETPPVYGYGYCPECDGDGYTGSRCDCCDNCCDRCFGSNGRLGPRCLACIDAKPKPGEKPEVGFGWLPAFHRVGCQLLAVSMNRDIQTLPGPIEFVDRPPPSDHHRKPNEVQGAIRFRFANGDGLVMGWINAN